MGCNTSQELKTKDDTGGDDGEQQAENGNIGNEGQKFEPKNTTNHSKSNSIISNGETKKQHAKDALEKSHQCGLLNGVPDRAEISELNDMELGEDEAKAATKIQAVFRGHKVRNTMKKSDNKTIITTTTTTISAVSATIANNTNKNGAAEAEPTKAELEAEFDPNDKELCDAALKIQSAFRGHMTRKTVKDAPEDVDIDEITKKVAEELDIDLTDPELNKAASKIQASFRGHKTRKVANTAE